MSTRPDLAPGPAVRRQRSKIFTDHRYGGGDMDILEVNHPPAFYTVLVRKDLVAQNSKEINSPRIFRTERLVISGTGYSINRPIRCPAHVRLRNDANFLCSGIVTRGGYRFQMNISISELTAYQSSRSTISSLTCIKLHFRTIDW